MKTNLTNTSGPAVIELIRKLTGNRTIKANILYSILIRGISVLTSFIMVPLTIGYLGTHDFGIWLTLSSIIAWFGFFDIGLSNGLKNKLTEAIALNDIALGRSYVSTAYAGLSALMLVLVPIFILINSYIDWRSLLNLQGETGYNLNFLALYVFALFALRMVLKLISVVLTSDQRPAAGNLFDPISNILSLIAIWLLTMTTKGSLTNFILVVTVFPVIVLLISNVLLFKGEYKDYKPSVKYIEMKQLKDLTGLGFKFFLIQIAVIVIFSTDNLIIARILGAEDVTIYNIAYKYFNIITFGFAIIMTPMWAAYTKAYSLENTGWIKKSTGKLVKLWFAIVVVTLLMILFANTFYSVWIGNSIKIPMVLNLFMGLFIIISTWNNIFVYFINSTGKITFQLYTSIIAAAVNIPVSIYLARDVGMGVSGVILGTCISLFPGVVLGPVQYKKILNKTDSGIWAK